MPGLRGLKNPELLSIQLLTYTLPAVDSYPVQSIGLIQNLQPLQDAAKLSAVHASVVHRSSEHVGQE